MLDIEFQREGDVAALESKLKNDKIKIVAGLRRAGKSYLLDPLLKRHLIVNGGFNERNFEIKDFSKQDEIDTDGKLRAYLNGLAFRRNLKFIFLDEPQETGENFAEILLKFHKAHPEYQIFITGSNSKTLSDDIVEYFGDDGDPLFIEALPYRDILFELPDFTLDDYFKVGGLPSVLVEETESERLYRLKMLYKGLYLTDVQDRLAKMGALKKLSYLEAERIIADVCSNLTTPISVSGIVTAHLGKGRASGSVERNAFSKDAWPYYTKRKTPICCIASFIPALCQTRETPMIGRRIKSNTIATISGFLEALPIPQTLEDAYWKMLCFWSCIDLNLRLSLILNTTRRSRKRKT